MSRKIKNYFWIEAKRLSLTIFLTNKIFISDRLTEKLFIL